MDWHQVTRSVHIGLGFAGFALGLVALLLPKFGPQKTWHRLVGRIYALAMLGMSLASVPLSIRSGNQILLTIGILTFLAVLMGWLAIRKYRSSPQHFGYLRWHLILLVSSYIAAWTAFLLTNPLLNGILPRPYAGLTHLFGPTIIGTIFITLQARRRKQQHKARFGQQ